MAPKPLRTFGDWLDAQPEHDAALARFLGMSRQRLGLYRHRRVIPRPKELYRLMAITKLPMEAFYPPQK